ncbi:hypothetical protein QYM36_004040 [Artemia franciscana]|uniref:Cadherin domain-containing protein n=1 Tax=Artemia franciscana TaxID=6661 RepID=A0AA88L7N7_ARTSF|nr:hypothetical protein QYM36_004040 [Artemia franciscana]
MGLRYLFLVLAALQTGSTDILPGIPKFRLPAEFIGLVVIERDTVAQKILCLVDFNESSEINLIKDYGHFNLKITENGRFALVLKKSLEADFKDHYHLVVRAISEQGEKNYLEIMVFVKDYREEELPPKIESVKNFLLFVVVLHVIYRLSLSFA